MVVLTLSTKVHGISGAELIRDVPNNAMIS